MDPALAGELSSIIAAARAHLEHEAALASKGLPAWAPPASEPAEQATERSRASAAQGSVSGVTRAVELLAQQAAERDQVAPSPLASSTGAHPEALAASPWGEERALRLAQLAELAGDCRACALHAKRKQSVFARGNPRAELVFVGEGPGAEEDRLGAPFVGPAGQLLDRMIGAMGYQRDDVYVCNVVKCRPPENRTPRPEEAIACARFLKPQLALVAPKLIVALGRCAAENLGVAKPEGSWRGRWGTYEGVPVMPTYHPAYLLRSPEQKRVVWEDLKLVMERLGRPLPVTRGAGG